LKSESDTQAVDIVDFVDEVDKKTYLLGEVRFVLKVHSVKKFRTKKPTDFCSRLEIV